MEMNQDNNTYMQPREIQQVLLIALIAMLRMFGLFSLLPVMSIYASNLDGATPILIGLSVGAYGLTQALLQIPFGFFSDKIGRKPVIFFGLVIFIFGSIISFYSETIIGLILGRLLQGAGAISATLSALLSDVTRDTVRTKSMAIFGVGIGASFLLSLILGPIISSHFGVRSLFIITVFMSVLSIMILLSIPNAKRVSFHAPLDMRELVRKPILLCDINIFFLHLVLTMIFVIFPFMMISDFNVSNENQWKFYISSLIVSLLFSGPLIMNDDRKKMNLIYPIAFLLFSQILLIVGEGSSLFLFSSLLVFFVSFNYLEATLPSRISIFSKKEIKGASLGVFSSCQFLGAFFGGLIGGILIGLFEPSQAHFVLTIIISVWFIIMLAFLEDLRGETENKFTK
tara:strand:+ start:745 stop:1941 length:1197 start_codon:yes stop_codon:yes gene_type:complete